MGIAVQGLLSTPGPPCRGLWGSGVCGLQHRPRTCSQVWLRMVWRAVGSWLVASSSFTLEELMGCCVTPLGAVTAGASQDWASVPCFLGNPPNSLAGPGLLRPSGEHDFLIVGSPTWILHRVSGLAWGVVGPRGDFQPRLGGSPCDTGHRANLGRVRGAGWCSTLSHTAQTSPGLPARSAGGGGPLHPRGAPGPLARAGPAACLSSRSAVHCDKRPPWAGAASALTRVEAGDGSSGRRGDPAGAWGTSATRGAAPPWLCPDELAFPILFQPR